MTFKTKLILFCFYQKKFLKCNFFTQNKNNIITCDNNKNTQNICCLHLCLLLKPVFYVTIFYRKVIKMFFFFGIMPYKKEIPYLFDCICPKCGKDIVLKKTKKGRRYFGCENNPECDFMSWQKPVSKKCPKCGGYMVEKGNKIACADETCGYIEAKTEKKEDK